jgi:hypothetical protein
VIKEVSWRIAMNLSHKWLSNSIQSSQRVQMTQLKTKPQKNGMMSWQLQLEYYSTALAYRQFFGQLHSSMQYGFTIKGYIAVP